MCGTDTLRQSRRRNLNEQVGRWGGARELEDEDVFKRCQKTKLLNACGAILLYYQIENCDVEVVIVSPLPQQTDDIPIMYAYYRAHNTEVAKHKPKR